MKINDAGQEVVGGVPTTALTINDITEHYGVIIWSNTDGDLATWDGESNTIRFFDSEGSGFYSYKNNHIVDDFEGKSLIDVVAYAEFNF